LIRIAGGGFVNELTPMPHVGKPRPR
jgi:hypothetical protein